MMLRRCCIRFLVALAVLLTLRCSWDAPRDNPLDPALGGNISGRVLTRRATPIAAARISIPASGRVVETDSAGNFDLRELPAESAWVFVTAQGYAAESSRLALVKGEIDTMTTYLDGLPYLQNCRVTTHVYGRDWPPEPLKFCTLSAMAGDNDGEADVDSVMVQIPAVGYSQRLNYNPDEMMFTQTLYSTDLPGQSLDTLVGQSVRFCVVDMESTEAEVTLDGITRIMTDLPEPAFPSGGLDTLSQDTTFSWYRFDHGFGVTYHGELVRIVSGSPAGVAADFDAADTTWRFQSSLLDSGDYYWTIEAIDQFGNSSRSAEELFHAK
ncbi:MAG TPA: carboxypeptidase-like regulatory domain-containing protein [bacterium]|nr:carboxypeptidase-like regulatory domain-containing protein [bacterium]